MRMSARVNRSQQDSDAAYFHDLLYFGELILKLITAEVLALVPDDADLKRLDLESRCVKASGIGDWSRSLFDALEGPTALKLPAGARPSQQALTKKFPVGAKDWQRIAIDSLAAAAAQIDELRVDPRTKRSSMRDWADTFVWLRNRTRGHGAPHSTKLSLASPELRSSLDSVISHYPGFFRSWAHLHRNISGKYRVTAITPNRDPFSRLTQESNFHLPNGTYIALDDEFHSCPLLITDSECSDFFLPNGAFKNGRFEVLSYLTDNVREVDGATYVLQVSALPRSETASAPDLDVVGQSFSNMPPVRPHYVSRPSLEKELTDLLLDDRHPVITLQGSGGIGKTSLALEVLDRIAHGGHFSVIYWASARDIDLLSEGHRVVRADVLNASDIARDFTALMRPDQRIKDPEQFLTDCLSGAVNDGPFIFVVDNFETIRGQSELHARLSNAVRLPNKVLVTTRTRDFKADYPVEVKGMSFEEYRTLVEEVCTRLPIRQLIDSSYLNKLYEQSGGHPYIVKISLGEVARSGRRADLKRVVANRDGLLEALFERSYSDLTPGAQRAFLTLASWRSALPLLGLEAVLLTHDDEFFDVREAIEELDRTSLVEIARGSRQADDFISLPLAALLFGQKKLVTSPLKVSIEQDARILSTFGPAVKNDADRGLNNAVWRLGKHLVSNAEPGAELDRELEVLEYVASNYSPAWVVLADVLRELGRDPGRAIERCVEDDPDNRNSWEALIRYHNSSGDTIAEMSAWLGLAKLTGELRDASDAANRMNTSLSAGELDLPVDEKKNLLSSLRTLMETRMTNADGTDFSRLAWLCLNMGDVSAAESWVDAGLRKDAANRHLQNLDARLLGG